MSLAPIILFVYNRLSHTNQTIEFLKKNHLAEESNLIIFSDGEKNIQSKEAVLNVRKLINNIVGFKTIKIIEREKNLGLACSIIDGVSSVINDYGKAIIMEDDLITSPYFLTFMNNTLNEYEGDTKVGSVSGYSFLNKSEIPADFNGDTYLSFRHSSWGWGTWKRVWNEIDWNVNDFVDFKKSRKAQQLFNLGGNDLTEMLKMQMKGELDSWSIRFDYNCYKKNLLSVLPKYSLVRNIGFDGTGVHSEVTSKYDIDLDDSFAKQIRFKNAENHLNINQAIKNKFNLSLQKKLINNLYRLKKKIYGRKKN
ncbi:MAG: sugar transferase [Bacteroidota bacterium]